MHLIGQGIQRLPTAAVAFVALLVMTSSGCNRDAGPKGEPTGSDQQPRQPPQFGEGMVQHNATNGGMPYTVTWQLCEERVFLVEMIAGGTVETGWKSADGRTGTVLVADRKYDLAKGGLFLISAKEVPPKVDQLAVDMSKLHSGKVEAELDAIAQTEPRLKAFLKQCRGEK